MLKKHGFKKEITLTEMPETNGMKSIHTNCPFWRHPATHNRTTRKHAHATQVGKFAVKQKQHIKSYCKTTHIEAAIKWHLFLTRGECIAGQRQTLGLVWMKRVAEGGPKKVLYKKKTCWHITCWHFIWHERTTLEETWTRVPLISHEIISHSHLSRNPLDSIVKSYCKTTHVEAAIKWHLFDKRGMHCWSKPPHVQTPPRHST